MDFRFVAPNLRSLDTTGAELLACAIWQDERPMRGVAGLLDWRLAGTLSQLERRGLLKGEFGEVVFVPGRPRLAFEKLLVFGLGARSGFGEGTFRSVVSHMLRALEGLKVRRAVVELPGRGDGILEAERACELVLECVGDSQAHDAWWLVEPPEAQRRISDRALDERRRSRFNAPADRP
jgi:Cytosol aminopeptidase family, N-terminal domain